MTRLIRYLLSHAFVRFAVIGSLGYVVGATVLALTTGPLKLEFAAGNALAIFIAMAFTWQGNRTFTFPDRRAHGFSGILQEWLKFMGANAVGALVNYLTALVLVHYAHAPFSNKFLAQAIGVLVGLVFNFTLSKTLVFKQTR
ncbi:MAG TPA: GtrA family protein [Rhizomicrobium sp.]|nr:GtrA family protein [Rhizomicrobium sp.]